MTCLSVSSRQRATLLALLAVSVVSSSASAQRPSPAALQRTVDSLVAAALTGGPMAAMSVAVVRGSDTLVSRGYGLADVENDVPATPGTVYRIGSITKQFTAAIGFQSLTPLEMWWRPP